MRVLGITGGIATGKSVVTALLAEQGAPTLSADALAHTLTASGTETTRAVLSAFPACADPADPCSLTLDRRALAQAVFADPDARRRLEEILHPPIIVALAAQAAAWRAQDAPRAGALEIPLLFETEMEGLVDSVVVVTCRPAAQATRLAARPGLNAAEAAQRIAAQWPLAEKVARADYVIDTDGTLEDTRRQVRALWQQLAG